MREHMIVKNYKGDDALRRSFNELAGRTFSLNFESWYQNGYWRENYIPYSIVVEGKVVSNISVNKIQMNEKGIVRNYIQLGTVMTDEAYRNQGLSRMLYELIYEEYKDGVDGIYLYANPSVVNFYPKFGFLQSKEFEYVKQVCYTHEPEARRIPMTSKEDWDRFEGIMTNSTCNSAFEMVGNPGLILFYLTQFMQDAIYFIPSLKTHVIAEIDEGVLLLHNVFSKDKVELSEVISAFGKGIHTVVLGFAPDIAEGFSCRELKEEDSTFFVLGKDLEGFEEKKLRFPTLSRA